MTTTGGPEMGCPWWVSCWGGVWCYATNNIFIISAGLKLPAIGFIFDPRHTIVEGGDAIIISLGGSGVYLHLLEP